MLNECYRVLKVQSFDISRQDHWGIVDIGRQERSGILELLVNNKTNRSIDSSFIAQRQGTIVAHLRSYFLIEYKLVYHKLGSSGKCKVYVELETIDIKYNFLQCVLFSIYTTWT